MAAALSLVVGVACIFQMPGYKGQTPQIPPGARFLFPNYSLHLQPRKLSIWPIKGISIVFDCFLLGNVYFGTFGPKKIEILTFIKKN
jgi:hypothetical protein